jgi:ribosome-associated translation inhibitor RaiA
MELPLQITSHDLPLTAAIEAEIRERAARLDAYYDRIMRCRVVIEAPVGHHRRGGPYNVRIDLTVPGTELVVNRQADEELPVAIRDAFDAMRRRLEDYARQQRGATKTHEAAPHGRVTKLFPPRRLRVLTNRRRTGDLFPQAQRLGARLCTAGDRHRRTLCRGARCRRTPGQYGGDCRYAPCIANVRARDQGRHIPIRGDMTRSQSKSREYSNEPTTPYSGRL